MEFGCPTTIISHYKTLEVHVEKRPSLAFKMKSNKTSNIKVHFWALCVLHIAFWSFDLFAETLRVHVNLRWHPVYPWQQNLAAVYPQGRSSMVTKMLIHSALAGATTRTPEESMVSFYDSRYLLEFGNF